MKRILITGVSGFIGRALAAEGISRGFTVFGIGSAPTPPTALAAYVRMQLPDEALRRCATEWQPEVIFHCAGSALPAKSFSSPSHDFRCSVPVVQDLLEAVRLGAPNAHVVMLSSAAVYGQPLILPIPEDQTPAPVSPYGFHKWMGEILAREYSEMFGMRLSTARIFSAYGPHLRKQIIWDSIQKFRGAGEAVFWGTGEETRDFIYIDDLTDALYRVGRREGGGHEVINIASGLETQISDVVAVVAQNLGVPTERWSFSGERDRAAPSSWRADISRLQSLGFVPSVSFEEGVGRTVKWTQNQPSGE